MERIIFNIFRSIFRGKGLDSIQKSSKSTELKIRLGFCTLWLPRTYSTCLSVGDGKRSFECIILIDRCINIYFKFGEYLWAHWISLANAGLNLKIQISLEREEKGCLGATRWSFVNLKAQEESELEVCTERTLAESKLVTETWDTALWGNVGCPVGFQEPVEGLWNTVLVFVVLVLVYGIFSEFFTLGSVLLYEFTIRYWATGFRQLDISHYNG